MGIMKFENVRELKYKSIFWMPRNFVNEGTYIYGTKKEINQFLDDYYILGNSNYCCVNYHYKFETAQKHCEKLAKRDNKNTPNHEICNITFHHVVHY